MKPLLRILGSERASRAARHAGLCNASQVEFQNYAALGKSSASCFPACHNLCWKSGTRSDDEEEVSVERVHDLLKRNAEEDALTVFG